MFVGADSLSALITLDHPSHRHNGTEHRMPLLSPNANRLWNEERCRINGGYYDRRRIRLPFAMANICCPCFLFYFLCWLSFEMIPEKVYLCSHGFQYFGLKILWFSLKSKCLGDHGNCTSYCLSLLCTGQWLRASWEDSVLLSAPGWPAHILLLSGDCFRFPP